MQLIGVTKRPNENFYYARIRRNGKLVYVGRSLDPKVAHEMYLKAREQFPDGRRKKQPPKKISLPENFIPELPKGKL